LQLILDGQTQQRLIPMSEYFTPGKKRPFPDAGEIIPAVRAILLKTFSGLKYILLVTMSET